MIRVLPVLCLALTACSVDSSDQGLEWSTDAQSAAMPAPGDLTLTVSPIVGGSRTNFTITGADAGATVYLVYSPNTVGDGACPAPLAPDCLFIPSPVNVLTNVPADADGAAVFSVVIPAPVPFSEVAFQAVTLGAENDTSNSVIALMHDADSDRDGDGLTAADELALDTDPAVFDTDGGGVGDGDELAAGTDPTDPSDDGGGVLGVDSLAPGDILVTEFIKDPTVVSDSNGEWLEIHNALGEDVDLSGLRIEDRDSDSYTVVGPLVVPAGGYAVLGRNADESINGGVVVDEAYSTAYSLANGADEVVLVKPDGTELFGIDYDDGVLWPDDSGMSIQLTPGGDPANPADWCHGDVPYGDGDNMGTPGAPNTECVVAPALTYTADVEPILASRCYSCHGGAGASGGVNFDTYDELFQASVDVPAIQLITPFDLDASYLWQKVNGTPAAVGGGGSQMPLSGGPLSGDEITLIADWIELGAPE